MTESWEEYKKRREKENWSKTDGPDFKAQGKRTTQEIPRYGPTGQVDRLYPDDPEVKKLAQPRGDIGVFSSPKSRSGFGVIIELPIGKDGTVEYVTDSGRIAHISGRRVDTGSNPNSIEFKSKFTGVTHTIPRDAIRMFANEQPKIAKIIEHYHRRIETCQICQNALKEE